MVRPKVWLEVWPGPTHKKCPCGLWPWRSIERARRAVDRGDETGAFIVCCSWLGYERGYTLHVVDSVRRGQFYWPTSREGNQGWSVML